jgi:hypothetical protein
MLLSSSPRRRYSQARTGGSVRGLVRNRTGHGSMPERLDATQLLEAHGGLPPLPTEYLPPLKRAVNQQLTSWLMPGVKLSRGARPSRVSSLSE